MAVTATPQRLLGHIEGRMPAMLELLRELVEIESPSTDPAASRQVLERLIPELSSLGFRPRIRPGTSTGGFLIARPAGTVTAPVQLVLGHGDTVWPLGTRATRPWEVHDGDAKGPGSFDMKAGLVQIVFALEAIRALDGDPPVTPYVLVNTDEEIGSRESGPTIDRLARISCRAFVLEPGLGRSGALKTARKGLGRYTVTIHGRAAHAGLDPTEGASAILELSSVIQRLFALNDYDRGITINVGTIEGGIRSNVVAPQSEASVDVRVLRHEDAASVDDAIRSLQPQTPGTEISVVGGFGRPPMERSAANAALFEAAMRIGTELGLQIEEVTAGGGSDGNTTSQHTATLDGLGPIGDGAHAPSEYVLVSSLPARTALLAGLLLEPVGDTPQGGDE